MQAQNAFFADKRRRLKRDAAANLSYSIYRMARRDLIAGLTTNRSIRPSELNSVMVASART